MRIDDYEDRFQEAPGRTTFRVALIVMFIAFGLSAVGWVWHLVTAPAVQAGRIIDKTIDADNVIYNYEWFHREYNDLQAMTPKLENAQAELKGFEDSAGPRTAWTFEDKQEHARLSSIMLGLKNQRATIVADYNAHASMSNREIFIGRSLPDHVE